MGEINPSAWQIPGSDGRPIYGNTHRPDHPPVGALICCHGFKGYKDYGFFPVLCERAARRGLIAHRFNFSHSGMTHDYERFENPELFEKDRWGRQIEDLGIVLNHLLAGSDLPTVIFGHSRGGVTSTLYCGNHAQRPIAGMITAGAPNYACKLDDLVKDQLRAEGRLLSPSGRTGQDLYVGLDWLEEIERDPEFYDPALAAAQIKCPMLILHGDDDETVPLNCARSLHQAATPYSRLEIIEGANHVFNCPNPVPDDVTYEQLPKQTRQMIDLSVAFAVRCCEDAAATG